MKRLLEIKEFFKLKKRDLASSSDNSRPPAKRPRRASKGDEQIAHARKVCTQAEESITKGLRERFLQLFENETTKKDAVWWLPGRTGEAFAMHKERFEHELLKLHFQESGLANFVKQLNLWGYRQMNITSLSGVVLTFEMSSTGASFVKDGGQAKKSGNNSTGRQNSGDGQHQPRATTHVDDSILNGLSRSAQQQIQAQAESFVSLQMEQAQYLVQQEIAHTYFSLLWQELQRQLSMIILQQTQIVATSNEQPQPNTMASPPPSTIVDVAALLRQQQIQQTSFYRAAIATPLQSSSDEHAVVQELNDIHQQQLSNLTHQIVALVAGNLEQQNRGQPEPSESSLTQKVLVKYLIALVLLQLQQQQHNLELLRQDRLTVLALIRSLRRTTPATSSGANTNEEPPQPVTSPHMQQLLAEAAMLSLSRAHQLLSEAALLAPLTVPPLTLPATPRHPLPLHPVHLPPEQLAQATGAFV